MAAQARIVALEQQLAGGGATEANHFETPDEALDATQLAARERTRAEEHRRDASRAARIAKARSGVVEKASRGSVMGSSYNFTTGAPVKTDVIVARGVVSAPTLAGFEIIPMTSANSPLFVFTDETVNGLYGDKFVAEQCGQGLACLARFAQRFCHQA